MELHHLTDALHRLVLQLDNEHSLVEPNQFRQRLEALDRLDAFFPYNPQATFGAASIEPGLYRRARAICARLEAVNCKFYEAIRCEIQRGSRPDTLLHRVHPSVDIQEVRGPTNGIGYDYLDELISGVLQFEEPDDGHILRGFEKVFYQPTPARHIFGLIGLTALTATDVFVDLGSGLGHVPLLVSICTHARRLHPSDETVFDGHTCSSLSFLPVPRGSRGSVGGGDVAPSHRKFVACVRHGVKNARVALAELGTAPISSACCSNSSGGR
jgi:hypothetical protein